MISRREWLGTSLGAGAALALTPQLLRALEQAGALHHMDATLMQRAIPSSGEMLPVISFGPRPTDGEAMKAVLKTFVDNGGKVVDVLHGGPAGEQGARTAGNELGIVNNTFWTTPLAVTIPVLPGYSGPPVKIDHAAVIAAMEQKFAQFKVQKIDLVMVSAASDVKTHLAVLRDMKKAGRVRYVGVHELLFPPDAPMSATARLESIMRNEVIDFIGVDYSVGDRRIEQSILPLAQERKIGVMAYFPFDRRRIFQRASSTPLPEWAAEFGATTWAQFFIKYVLSHPAVTVVRTGTTNPAHMLDNIGGGTGQLPNEAMRKRMAELVDALPATPAPAPPPQPTGAPPAPVVLTADVLDRYVGAYHYAATNTGVTVRRDGDRLRMKIEGTFPEGPLVARSETRFVAPWGAPIDFQLDAQGKVTGAVVQSGPYRILLERR